MSSTSDGRHLGGCIVVVFLLVPSLIFVALGALFMVLGQTVLGLMAVGFFGGCALVFLTMLIGPESRYAPVIMAIGSIVMGIGCLVVFLDLLGAPQRSLEEQLILLVAPIGVLLFGAGGMYLLIQPLRVQAYARKHATHVPSPVLSLPEVQRILEAEEAELGREGGRAGTFWEASARAGAMGGEHGARVRARSMSYLDGGELRLALPVTEELVQKVQDDLFDGQAFVRPSESEPSTTIVLALLEAEGGPSHRCVLQLLWSRDGLMATAHAREGMPKKGICAESLERLDELLRS